jgi:hypothetical protein
VFSGTIPLFAKDVIMTDIKRKFRLYRMANYLTSLKTVTVLLNSLPTTLIQCYLVENQENKKYDRVRVAAAILLERYREEGRK